MFELKTVSFISFKNCTVGGLIPENNGPSKLYKLSTINFVPHENPNPSFACQKIEGYDSLGNFSSF